ncbi:hypothetical protein [Flavobacterium sp.]|uniref:hypothetical protein n=1 Tax=Flavobacterium sp. TaxID=239 RepID=UPI0026131CA8|nr:hypothetical protein [Flavobacterium sp.]
MKTNQKLIILALLFIITLGNYSRIGNFESIRTVEFLSIFALGAITSLFLREIIITVNK